MREWGGRGRGRERERGREGDGGFGVEELSDRERDKLPIEEKREDDVKIDTEKRKERRNK